MNCSMKTSQSTKCEQRSFRRSCFEKEMSLKTVAGFVSIAWIECKSNAIESKSKVRAIVSLNLNHSNFSIYPSQSKSFKFASESRRRSGTPNDAIDSGSLASESFKPAAVKASSMDSNTLNVGLKQEPQIFLSSSLETRATAKVNFGDVKSFEQNDLRLQNDYFEELDMIPTVAKTLLQNGKNESP